MRNLAYSDSVILYLENDFIVTAPYTEQMFEPNRESSIRSPILMWRMLWVWRWNKYTPVHTALWANVKETWRLNLLSFSFLSNFRAQRNRTRELLLRLNAWNTYFIWWTADMTREKTVPYSTHVSDAVSGKFHTHKSSEWWNRADRELFLVHIYT